MKQQQPGKRGLQKKQFLFVVVTLLPMMLIAWWLIPLYFTTQEEYISFTRPDGNYRVVVLRTSTWSALMPGQAGDAPGKVQLYDRHGKLLHETKVEMVQLVDHVNWTDKKAQIKLVAEWDLPD